MTPDASSKPYHRTVVRILRDMDARRVLDAPCGEGWLGHWLRREHADTLIDGVGLWEFPPPEAGYRRVLEHDLEQPLPPADGPYDAIVCGEAIHLLTNPGNLLASFAGHLRPGGRVIITTPNTWTMRSRLRFLLRGFHSGFSPMIGKRRGQDYIAYFPWSFPQLHLLLTHYGYQDVTIHEVDEPKPKRAIERLLALPSVLYLSHRARRSANQEERQYWLQAATRQSLHGRWLVVSARTPS